MKIDRSQCWQMLLCMVFGTVLAVLPHALAWHRTGSPGYIADADELGCYMPAVAQAYYSHPWSLSDPARASGGVCFYPWTQFVPWVVAAELAGLDPLGVLLLWRVWAGASLGAVFWLLGRRFLGPGWLAVLLALLCLTDVGFFMGRPLDRQLAAVIDLLRGETDLYRESWAPLLKQFRLITPGVSWFFLGCFVLAADRAKEKPSVRRYGLAMLAFGLLFHVYFYYWTTAVVALVAMVLLDRQHWRHHALILAGGGLVGAPALWANLVTKRTAAEGWPQRLDLFVTIGRFDELILPKVALFWWLLTGWWVWRRHRDLRLLWCLAGAGFALMNHQLVTRLQTQNDHFGYVCAPVTVLLVWLVALRELKARFPAAPSLRRGGFALAAMMSAGAVMFRIWATHHNLPSLERQAALARFRQEQARAPGAVRLVPNQVIAGDPAYTDHAVVFAAQRALVGSVVLSPGVSDAEWTERRLLDGLARGLSPEAAAAATDGYPSGFYSYVRLSPEERQRILEERRRLAVTMAADLGPWLRKFSVRYLALPATAAPPAGQGVVWHRLPGGAEWQLWEVADPAKTDF